MKFNELQSANRTYVLRYHLIYMTEIPRYLFYLRQSHATRLSGISREKLGKSLLHPQAPSVSYTYAWLGQFLCGSSNVRYCLKIVVISENSFGGSNCPECRLARTLQKVQVQAATARSVGQAGHCPIILWHVILISYIGVGDARRLGVQETFAQLFPRNARKPCHMRLT